ncbi:hypothetical protein STAS_27485 [Striga asiatica]|uniref:Uncharacterized protein n=1 Tax=Striga asiatica TaxID=4170 RepID=A0A5A7QXS5_STRAF|nr:hypothetical protein STAS_27485 [Striga asiatica]
MKMLQPIMPRVSFVITDKLYERRDGLGFRDRSERLRESGREERRSPVQGSAPKECLWVRGTTCLAAWFPFWRTARILWSSGVPSQAFEYQAFSWPHSLPDPCKDLVENYSWV